MRALAAWPNKRLIRAAGAVLVAEFLLMLTVVFLYSTSVLQLPKEFAVGAGNPPPTSWLHYLLNGPQFLVLQITNLPFELGTTGVMVVVGFVAARKGILSRPEQHRRLLIWCVIVSGVLALALGVPLGLVTIGALPADMLLILMLLNRALGLFTGPGIIAAVTLAALPLQRRIDAAAETDTTYRLPLLVAMVVALGKRSMTGYIMQSMILFPLTAPFLLGVLEYRGVAFSVAVGGCVWGIVLVVAYFFERAGKPGPFEALHRQWAYGKNQWRLRQVAGA